MSTPARPCPQCHRTIKWALKYCTFCTSDKFIKVRGEKLYAEFRPSGVVKKERVSA